MIPTNDIALWGEAHPWQLAEQVEQDLLLSQAICAIANDPMLGDELAIRGGTAYHKLFLPEPYRYSEDLDYVRVSSGGIGPVMRRLTDVGRSLGFKVNTQMGKYPKIIWRFLHASGTPGKIKIEINTYERSPMLPLQTRGCTVRSQYCTDEAQVLTFQAEELVATKIRALYQRSKGRDLYDLWLALTLLHLSPESILKAFPAYRPDGLNVAVMRENVELKLGDTRFCGDMDRLIRLGAPEYDVQQAGELVLREIVDRIDDAV